MISHKYKFAFLHLPKCAGSTIMKSFGRCWNDKRYKNGHPHLTTTDTHYSLHRSDTIRVDLDINEYKLFTFVRNPYSRIVSAFFYLRDTNLRYRQDRHYRNTHNLQEMNFSEFVKEKLLIAKYPHFDGIVDKYIKSEDLEKFDFIGKTENMQTDCDLVCDIIKRPKRILPHDNKSEHKHYTEYYDDESRKIVANIYAKDIEYFDYEFGK